jgi:hypothetical protein
VVSLGHGFRKGGQFRPITPRSHGLSLEQLGVTNLNSPSKSITDKIKRENLDAQGNFTQDSKKIRFEGVRTLASKRNLFLLKGTDPNNKIVTKTVRLSN